jgi:hypothetical protein
MIKGSAPMPRIQDVPDSNPDRVIGYPDRDVSYFSSVPQANASRVY